jgi:hypothetical protein
VISDPAGIVSHLAAAPVAGAQEEAVKVVVYLRTAASFEVQQESDVIRLAMTKGRSYVLGEGWSCT